ncbi:MAG: hypothetical protein EOP48_16935 [Sphingobacteriales bacterium]|nr:MAG: hypothetical protein EOP48_16935 [Sphingobacteriales bacterium]
MRLKILIFAAMLQSSIVVSAQGYDTKKSEFVNDVLSDTLIGFGNFVPLRIKFKDGLDTFIYYQQTQFLYQHFRVKFGWDGRTFMDKLRSHLLSNDVLIADNGDSFFNSGALIRIGECDCLADQKADHLIQIITDRKYPPPRSGKFACLVYRCFEKYVMVGAGEEIIWASKWHF